MIQPKFVAGLFTHCCTSAFRPAPVHWYLPTLATDVLALAAATKSPPGVAQRCELKNVKNQVTSPVAAATPSPSPDPCPPVAALDGPSPQFASARCSTTFCAPLRVFDMF